MSDFAQNFIQGVQAGQARAKAQKDYEIAAEERDLKKQMLKHQMDRLKIEDQLHARELATNEAKIPQMGVPTDTAGLAGSPIMGPPNPDPVARGEARDVALPAVEGMAPASSMRVPTIQGSAAEQLRALVDKEKALRELPPTQDQIADNTRLETEMQLRAEDRRATLEQRELDRVQRHEDARLNAANLHEYRMATLEFRRDAASTARAQAKALIDAKQVDPKAAEYLARQIAARNTPFESISREQEKPVTEALLRLGLEIPRKLTAKELAAKSDADAGLNAVDNLEDLLKRDPDLPMKSAAAGVLGPVSQYVARKLDDNVAMFQLFNGEVADIKTRIRTGAAVNDQELKFYGGQAVRPGEPVEVSARKIAHFRGFYLAVSGKPVLLVSPDGKQKRAITDGYDQKQRNGMRKLIDAGWMPQEFD